MYSFHQKLQIQYFISFQRKSLYNVDKAGSKVSKNIEICSKNPFSKIKFIFTVSSHILHVTFWTSIQSTERFYTNTYNTCVFWRAKKYTKSLLPLSTFNVWPITKDFLKNKIKSCISSFWQNEYINCVV